MLSAGPSFFILGVVVAVATADNLMVLPVNSSMSVNVTATPFTSIATGTFTPSNGNRSSTTAQANGTSISTPSTFTPSRPPATKSSNSKEGAKTRAPKMTAPPVSESDDSTGIIIFVVIIIIALGFGFACYVARKRGRHYSVDFNSRADDANIPLSNVEPEMTADAVTQNGLKTFESADVNNEAGDEAKVELKAEAENAAIDPAAESAAPVKPPDEPKGDIVEWKPPEHAELRLEEKTDDEGLNSNKTSLESLREANENNSNNAGPHWQRDLFWDVPLGVSV